MPAEQSGRERDLVLSPGRFAYIQDETKGGIGVYVGPNKTSLAGTDRPVVFVSGKFEPVSLDKAIQEFPLAEEGSYIVLENPSTTEDLKHPLPGAPSNAPKLQVGRKIIVPGPATFPLWPGQVARVIGGHSLRSNQYVLARVYNEEAARTGWASAVMKPASAEAKPLSESNANINASEQQSPQQSVQVASPDLTMGKLLVIQGTNVSFYIPPTGIEVVPDSDEKFVREAVTLERLEYCILLDESGKKRFVQGPNVVFPSPTETFVEKGGERKFRATELNDDMGILVKVIEAYEEDGTKHAVGDELFITGKDQRIYFPRTEHAIVLYGDRDVHYGVAIPAGEGRYVLDKRTGKVELVRGPQVFLADPRYQVLVRRVLDEKTVGLLYPGNQEAVLYNRGLRELSGQTGYVAETTYRSGPESLLAASASRGVASKSLVADGFQRGQSYTPPRTITLDTKYDGAVTVKIWTGYAVLIVNKTGGRRVAVGPQTTLLEYDETPEVLALSTGKPKNTDRLEQTVYLRSLYNQVSDIVTIITKDMVKVDVKLSYRVNFEGDDHTQWFSVENYVKFLCDHMRSVLRNVGKQHSIEKLNEDPTSIIRNAVLGAQSDGKRTGKFFEENAMRIYDVEVLGIIIGDEVIAGLMNTAQYAAVKTAIETANKERELELTKRLEGIKQKIDEITAETKIKQAQIKEGVDAELAKQRLSTLASQLTEEVETRKVVAERQKSEDEVAAAELERERKANEQSLAQKKAELDQELEKLRAETEAHEKRIAAISPSLIGSLQSFGDRHLVEKVAESLGPMHLLGGGSLAEIVQKALAGTPLANVLSSADKAAKTLSIGSR